MRRFITAIALAMTIAVVSCMAQPADVEIVYPGSVQQLFMWDEVTLDNSGNPFIEGDVVRYEVFWRHSALHHEGSFGVVEVPEMLVSFSGMSRGYYYLGVRSIGIDQSGMTEYSQISWSNNLVAVQDGRFAIIVPGRFVPEQPTGVRMGD